MGKKQSSAVSRFAQGAAALALSLAVALVAQGAAAQSVGDFRLEPGQSQQPRAAGPVDPEAPASARPSAAPSAAPSVRAPAPQAGPSAAPGAAPSARPVITIPPNAAASRAPVQSAPAARPGTTAPAGSASPAPSNAANAPAAIPGAPPAGQGAAPAGPSFDLGPAAEPLPAPAASDPALSDGASASGSGLPAWVWLAAAIVVLGGAIGTWLVLSARRQRMVTPELVRPSVARPAPAPVPAPTPSATPAAKAPLAAAPLAPQPTAAAEPATPPSLAAAPQPAAPGDPLALQIDPRRMSVSLVNATLHYRLRLANGSGQPIGPVTLGIDMIAANAALPAEEQLALSGAPIAERHRIESLGAGEEIELSGDLRLPLAQIVPIKAGAAALFVPLVRLQARAGGIALTRAVVVGETPAVHGGPLRPFRLDQGPRIFGAIEQRQLAAA